MARDRERERDVCVYELAGGGEELVSRQRTLEKSLQVTKLSCSSDSSIESFVGVIYWRRVTSIRFDVSIVGADVGD